MSRQLTQHEIDAVFERSMERRGFSPGARKATTFDFRRPDRISKSQLRAIHMLHDNFVRNLVSSLSAYLRAYLSVNLVSVEQLSYAEFLEGLPSPTCVVSLGLRPYDGSGVMELNPTLVFPILETLLGGSGKTPMQQAREMTEIEQALLDGLFRIVLNDLRDAWKGVTVIEFTIESIETEPQFLQMMAPNEAVVAIAIEIRIGESVGMMNIAIPSIIIKMMRQKFDQQWSLRKTEPTEEEQARMLRLVQPSQVGVEAVLDGATISIADLMRLKPGDVLTFDYPVHKTFDCNVNGTLKYRGKMVTSGKKQAFMVDEMVETIGPTTDRRAESLRAALAAGAF